MNPDDELDFDTLNEELKGRSYEELWLAAWEDSRGDHPLQAMTREALIITRREMENIHPRLKLPAMYDECTQQQRKELREEYARLNFNMCFYCHYSLDEDSPYNMENKPIKYSLFPPAFFSNPVHLQHDHDTGLTEGAVHSYCNAVMWQYEGR